MRIYHKKYASQVTTDIKAAWDKLVSPDVDKTIVSIHDFTISPAQLKKECIKLAEIAKEFKTKLQAFRI
jgi:hypothetical protein